MRFPFPCPLCGARLEAAAEQAGTDTTCAACGRSVTVPPKTVGPGAVVGRFRVERLLAEGGRGTVYLATQLSMDRVVALKILPPDMAADPALVEQFLNEARLQARLDHPNVVAAYEAGEDAGYYYLAMKYVAGETLAERLRRHGRLPEREALRHALAVARALAYAWSQHRILHHDVKPGNILVDANGEAYLLDMGISGRFRERSQVGDQWLEGTPEYMSPERIRGQREPDPRSDMYSLGVTLYELLTGSPPFVGRTPEEVLRRQAIQPLPSLRRRAPEISEECERLVEWLLAKDPLRRPANWELVVADLQRVLAGRKPTGQPLTPAEAAALAAAAVAGPKTSPPGRVVVAAKPHARPPPPARPAPPPRRSSVAPAVTGVAVMAIVIVGLVAILQSSRSRQPPRPVSGPAPVSQRTTPPELWTELEAALEYARTHPADYVANLQRLDRLRTRAAGTEIEARATEAIQQLRSERQAAIRAMLTQLKADAERRMAQGRYLEAIRMVRDYTGPFAADTAEQRGIIVEELKSKLPADVSAD